ncbi:MAG: hypothetical protein JSV23_01245 [Promethearchaeota archaeon]|nr:MAG: hypothetical protein JSV23_01245 [Candidatus Lokiarchaeota archaeon]
MESDKVEIIDFSGEKFNNISIPWPVSLVLIILLVILNIFLMVSFPGTFISIFVSLIILCAFGLYYSYSITKNPGFRKFSISSKEIEIIVPKKPNFLIYWSEFKKVEIRLKRFNTEPFYIYELHFINQESDRTFNLSLSEFPKKKIDQILLLIKDYTKKIGKQFTAVKEKWISGVVLVENLKI